MILVGKSAKFAQLPMAEAAKFGQPEIKQLDKTVFFFLLL
jgi:hypothetical protein